MEEVMHSITLSLDEDGGMGNSSIPPHSPHDSHFSTQQPTAEDSEEREVDTPPTDTAAGAAENETARGTANGTHERATDAEDNVKSTFTNGDAAEKASADSASTTAKHNMDSDDDADAPPPVLLAPPSPNKEATSASTHPTARPSTSSTPLSGPHGNTNWEVEKLVEQRESKGHIWFRVKWKEFNTMTWEEEKNLHNCDQLIREFREKAGLPTGDKEKESDEDAQNGQIGEEEDGEEESKRGPRGRKRKSESSTTAATKKKAVGGRPAAGGRKAKAAADRQEEQQAEDEADGHNEQKVAGHEDGDGEVEEDDEDEAPEYEVESIISHVVDDDRVTFYEVKWKGYKKPTWEPEVNLVGCDELLAEYKRAHVKKQPPKVKAKKGGRGRSKKATATKAKPAEQEEEDDEVVEVKREAGAEQSQTNQKKAVTRGRRKKAEKASENGDENDGLEERAERTEGWEDEEKESVEEKKPARASKKARSTTEERGDQKEQPLDTTTTAEDGGDEEGGGGEDSTEAENENKEWDVEAILDMDDDPTDSSERLYLVKWKDWPPTTASWVPASNFSDQSMVNAFLKDRGLLKQTNTGERQRTTRTVGRVRVR